MAVKIRERPKGSGEWWILIDHQGRRKAKKIGKDRELAQQVAKRIEAKLLLNEYDFKTRPVRFGEYARKWLEFVRLNRRASTYERYEGVLQKHVLPVFRKKALTAITRGDIRDFMVKKAQDYDVKIFRDVLSGIFGFAVDDELIPSNPVTGITKRLDLRKDRSKDVDPFNPADLALFLETTGRVAPGYHIFFVTAVKTGLRLGELLALRWGDLDFNHSIIVEGGRVEERPFLWVRRTYRRGRVTPPKNGKVRKVDMSAQLKAALLAYRAKEKKRGLKAGRGGLPALVFHKDGRILEQNYIRRVFNRVLSTAGLKHRKLHSLRHTFASLLLSLGESPVYVKEQLGHHSIQLTVDIYGKWIETDRAAGVNKLDTATYPQPATTKTAQVMGIAPETGPLVPKGGVGSCQNPPFRNPLLLLKLYGHSDSVTERKCVSPLSLSNARQIVKF